MRFRPRTISLLGALTLALSIGGYRVARADAPSPRDGPGDTSSVLAPVVAGTADERAKQGDLTVARLEMGAGIVRRMLQKARAERDIVRTLCLNDKLTQLDVTLRSAKERRAALEAATNRRDDPGAGHELTVLGVYRQRGDRLLAESNQCVGTDPPPSSASRLTVSVDPTLPDEGDPKIPIGPVTVPPSCASCAL
jgi:hypothetical protein